MAMPFEHLRGPEDSLEGLEGASVEQTNPNANGLVEAAQGKQDGAWANEGRFGQTIQQIRAGGAEQLADYLSGLSEEYGLSGEQRDKIDTALDMRGRGIADFSFVSASHQREAMELLNNIAIAQDGEGIRRAAKSCAEKLDEWQNEWSPRLV
jgi:hypothetical protein